MGKKCILLLALLTVLVGIIIFISCGEQRVRCETGINNLDHYYILEFEKMNQEESYVISACKDDVFDVNFRIDQGRVDFIIGMDGEAPIYKGNNIETGMFEVIAPEDGEYRITVNAKRASGFIKVYAKRGNKENECKL